MPTQYSRVCPTCATPFTTTMGYKRFCSEGCYVGPYRRVCATCGTEFNAHDHRKRYCSRACVEVRNRVANTRTCVVCGTVFVMRSGPAHVARFGDSAGRYCSRACMYRRNANRAKRSGHPRTCDWCSKTFMADRPNGRLPRFCDRRCYAAWLSSTRRGENATGWKGGLTVKTRGLRRRIEYSDFRKSVIARDGGRCVHCRRVPKRLHVHHLLPVAKFPQVAEDERNGVVLCEACHYAVHHSGLAVQLPLGVGVTEPLTAIPVERVSRPRRKSGARGSQNGFAKLREDDVRALRERRAAGEIYRTIAADYGVTIACVARICAGKSWEHIA